MKIGKKEEETDMFLLLGTALLVTFMFFFDYVLDGEKVFHVESARRDLAPIPFTTIQALVMSK